MTDDRMEWTKAEQETVHDLAETFNEASRGQRIRRQQASGISKRLPSDSRSEPSP